jgi:SNF2 family DNA or RNA helicase
VSTTVAVDLSRCKLPPFAHQIVGIEKIVSQPLVLLFDEMGVAKSKQVIDAAQILYTQGIINRVVVIAPLSVLDVWYDPELGELAKHLWDDIPVWVTRLRTVRQKWERQGDSPSVGNVVGSTAGPLRWVITNYDYTRSHWEEIARVCDKHTLLVLDESSAIKSWKSLQTKACEKIRVRCGRVVQLNGTPVANKPDDLYSQAHLLDPEILGCSTYYHFRARYCIMGGFKNKQIIKFVNLDDLSRRLKPFVLRRLKKECLDLPEKLPPVTLSVPLSAKSWAIYKEMRDELVAYLSSVGVDGVSSAPQAMTKGIRLAQICSGMIGGVEDELGGIERVEVIGVEKINFVLEWFKDHVESCDQRNGSGGKVIFWCRFRSEVERLARVLPGPVGLIYGGQTQEDRQAALRLLDPRTAPVGRASVVGTAASGAMGLNLTAADTAVYVSNTFPLKDRLQSEDRNHRIGQIRPVSYFDIVATGPEGQRTIDHMIIKALRSKHDLATLTCSEWVEELKEE